MKRTTVGWLAVVLQGLLLLALIIAPGRRPWSQLWPPDLTMVIGVLCLIGALWLLVVAARTLSSALTPNPVPLAGQTLRTSGVYRWVRHPIYSAVLLGALGYTIAVGSWWQVGITAALAGFFVLKAKWEDSLLAEQYGDQWRDWRATTGALVPRLTKR